MVDRSFQAPIDVILRETHVMNIGSEPRRQQSFTGSLQNYIRISIKYSKNDIKMVLK